MKKDEFLTVFGTHDIRTLEDIQEPLTPREFTRCAIAAVSRWCDNVLTGRYSSVESVGRKLDCLERIYKNR